MESSDETLYEVLGVGRSATADEIRKAYLNLASQYHPDRHEGNPLADLAEQKLAAANAAYEVLSDPVRRATYDADLAAGRPPRAAPAVSTGVKMVLRVLGGFVVLILVMRLVPPVWRLLRLAFAPLAGTPAVPLAALALVTVIVVLVRRRRANRTAKADPAPH
jgi:DnaJ-domain-containing protein 1